MQLVEVTTAAQAREFLEFPPRVIYARDPNYIRPWNHDVEAVFDPEKNKLFQKGELIRWLLLDAQGNTIGRVAAFFNRETAFLPEKETVEPVGEEPVKVDPKELFRNMGAMGFFECIDDQPAANMLFDACRDWLAARGLEGMDGPVNFGDRDQWWGLVTENFGPPIYRANYNPPYYEKLFRTYGFETYYRQISYRRTVEERLRPAVLNRAERIYKDPRYEFRHMRKKEWPRYAEDFRTIYNKAWVKHGVKSMSAEAGQKLMKSMLDIVDERIVWFGYYDGEPIAFYINLPEINEIVRHLNGKLGLLEKLKFKYHQLRGTVQTMFGVVFGVVPEFQRKGVEAALAYAASLVVHDPKSTLPYKQTIMNWIGDFNPKMMVVVELIGGKPWRHHETLRYYFDRRREFQRHPVID